MFKRPTRWMATAALVIGTLTACHDGPGPTAVEFDSTTETVSADAIGTPRYDVDPTLASAYQYTESTGAMLLETKTVDPGNVGSVVVGTGGGTITVGIHTLEIPQGAVSGATVFTMEIVGGTNILVDLSAQNVATGETVSEFPVPLTLKLSYAGVFSGGEAKRLRNVYLYLDSPSYLIPLESSRDRRNKTISSPISHFSLYGMAIE